MAQIRADTRRTSTESWAKYFISTDAGIKSVTKKLFCIVFLCYCFVLFYLQAFMLFIYLILYNFPINIRLDKGKDNGAQNNNLGNERGQVTRQNWLMN